MTDLRTRTPAAERSGSHRPLQTAATLAALSAAAIGLGLCMAVAVIGWFLADAGSHGNTTDALRVGADGWLLAHGSRTVAAGTPLGILPLGLTGVLLLVGWRCGRHATTRVDDRVDDRALGQAVGLAALCYAMAVVMVGVLNTHDNADPSLPRALAGAVLVSVLGLGLGLAHGTGRLVVWWDRLPLYARTTAQAALLGALVLVAGGALLVAVALLASFNDASMLMSSMRLGVGDALMVTAISALVAPNAALFGSAWLIGPGFTVGAGTSVAPGEATLGPLPNFPLLAALPADGQTAGLLVVLMAFPVLVAAVAAGWGQRRYGVRAWDSAALRGFGVGLGSALLVSAAMVLAGGPMGTGRMAEFGPPLAEVLVVSVGGMSLGGLVGGLAVTAWQRTRDRRKAEPGVR